MHSEPTISIDKLFSIFKKADITISDVSRLTGLSRNTLHGWKNKKHTPDSFRLHIVRELAKKVVKAKWSSLLPLKEAQSVAERTKTLKRVLS